MNGDGFKSAELGAEVGTLRWFAVQGSTSLKVTVEGRALLSTAAPLVVSGLERVELHADTLLLLLDGRIEQAQAQARREMIEKLRLTLSEQR